MLHKTVRVDLYVTNFSGSLRLFYRVYGLNLRYGWCRGSVEGGVGPGAANTNTGQATNREFYVKNFSSQRSQKFSPFHMAPEHALIFWLAYAA